MKNRLTSEELTKCYNRLKKELPEEHVRKLAFSLDPLRISNCRSDEGSAIPTEIAKEAAERSGLKFFEKRTNCVMYIHIEQYFY